MTNKALIAVKPQFTPPRILSNLTEGIHPDFSSLRDYVRRITRPAETSTVVPRAPYFDAALADYPIQ